MAAALQISKPPVHAPSAEDISKLHASLQVAKATAEDAEGIAKIVNTAFNETDFFRNKANNRTSAADVVNDLKQAKYTWYVVTPKVETKPRTISATMLYTQDSATECSIHMLATDLKLKGMKLGSMLIQEAEKRAKQDNMHVIRLEAVTANEKLVAYYEKHGFVKTNKVAEFCADWPPALLPKHRGPDYVGGKIMYVVMEKLLQKPTETAPVIAQPISAAAAGKHASGK